ncbi:MAG: sulfatase-like hydrolase/transferase [Chitinophagaceae bacterium]|nr:sulfatase-like hydrolase/transferase [Chitinophagaceae bacterium]
MKRLLLAAFGLLISIISGSSQERVAPNIIIILADDLGYGDMSVYNGDVPVPALTQMAKEGMRFTDFHSNGAVCSPTRAALLTGRYQQRMGIEKALNEKDKGLSDEKAKGEVTLAQYLQEAGYKTAILGKWHLGSQKRHKPASVWISRV